VNFRLSDDRSEAARETLEILADDELMAALRESLRQADSGELIPWEQVKAELNLRDDDH
jgi:hypothetical protein